MYESEFAESTKKSLSRNCAASSRVIGCHIAHQFNHAYFAIDEASSELLHGEAKVGTFKPQRDQRMIHCLLPTLTLPH